MLRILLVDHDLADAKLIRHFARLAGVENQIDHATGGENALTDLESEADLPGLVLPDINMPGMNEHETLAAFRGHADPNIAQIPADR